MLRIGEDVHERLRPVMHKRRTLSPVHHERRNQDVFQNGALREQVVKLKNEANVAAAQFRQRIVIEGRNVNARYQNPPRSRPSAPWHKD